MALKTIKRCMDCENDCKIEVDEKLWKTVEILSCGNKKQYKKKKSSKK